MGYQHIVVPNDGTVIKVNSNGSLVVPDRPVIPFIEGDGIGVDVTPAMLAVTNAAVKLAYGNSRSIAWMEIYNGEKAAELYQGDWFPAETLDAIREYKVAIKGPLTTPVGGGFRSLNVALRQELDLYVCQRPVRWFKGVPSPVKEPNKTDMVIFRENSEDIYAGIEWKAGTEEVDKVISFLREEMGVSKIRFLTNCGIGVKPVSAEGTKRLVRKAFLYCIDQDLPSVTLVHKGNIMKFTEGAFKEWGYQLAKDEFGAVDYEGGPWQVINHKGREIIIKDAKANIYRKLVIRGDKLIGIVLYGDVRSGSWYFEQMKEAASISKFMPELIFGETYIAA